MIDGGNGYTTAPKVITTKQFDILSEREIGVSLINLRMSPIVENAGINITSTIDILGNRLAGVASYSSVDLRSPTEVDPDIEAEIQTGQTGLPTSNVVGDGFDMPGDSDQPGVVELGFFIESQPIENGLLIQHNASVVSAEIQDIITVNSISTVSKAITTTIQNLIPNDALSNINYFENAAYLDLDFNIGDYIAYIPDTSKFYGTGFLLIGDEVVSYNRKLSDRFINIIRARRGTTEKNWTAGTFLRQIPELVSVAPVGVAQIESASQLVTVSGGAVIGRTEQRSNYQIVVDKQTVIVSTEIEVDLQQQLFVDSISEVTTRVSSNIETPLNDVISTQTVHNQTIVRNELQTVQTEFVLQKNQLEVLLFTPPGGVVDGYQEEIFLADPVPVRSGNTTGGHNSEVDLIEINDGYHVARRNSTEVLIVNLVAGRTIEYIGNYTKTNAGYTISHFDGIFDDGSANVSGLTLLELDIYFRSLTIEDFNKRGDSSYTLSGDKFNILPPSIQNPVAISSSAGTIGGNIIVQDTTYFPDDGYLFTTGGTVIKYTGKTSTSFTGCTLIRGTNSIANGHELVPFAIF